MTIGEFWASTPGEISTFLEGVAGRQGDALDTALIGAWHQATFALTGQVPGLKELLDRRRRAGKGKGKARPPQLPFDAEMRRWERFFGGAAKAKD